MQFNARIRHRASLLVTCLALGWASCAWADSAPWPGLAWPVDGDLSNTAALELLLPIPTGAGNACAEYTKLTALEGQPSPYPELGIQMERRQNRSADDKTKLEKLAADAAVVKRLEVFRKAAKMGHCQTLGDVHAWPSGGNPMSWPMVMFQPIVSHAAVVEQLAWTLAKEGKIDEAKAWMESLVYGGWHLQNDVVLISNLVGVALGRFAAEGMADILEAHDKTAAKQVKRWRAYAGLTQWRRYEVWSNLLRPMLDSPTYSDDTLRRLAAIASEKKMMKGARTEAILALATAHIRRKGTPEPSALQRQLFGSIDLSNAAGVAGAKKSFAPFLDLDAAKRAALAKEVAQMKK